MGSVRRKGSGVRVVLEPEETALLRALVDQVIQLLDPGEPLAGADPLEELVGMSSTPVSPPTDPALQRLLPDAYSGDDEAAGEFRRLTDTDVRTAKRLALQQIVDALESAEPMRSGATRVVLDEAAITTWLPALTDVRLTVASRLDIDDTLDLERMTSEPGSVRSSEISLYDWLGWLQESLVHALTGD